ncbi:MAG: N-acetyltransferase [Pseudomonadota bacterium]
MVIRPTQSQDHDSIWVILKPIFRAGETYSIDPNISRVDALAYWTGGTHRAFVAEEGSGILGTYYIRPNQGGHGRHICNCGYMTAPVAQGKGVARAMLEHSLKTAPEMGFRAMQYNFVLANNHRAMDIWMRYGFEQIGRIPEAFDHPKDGFVDAYILYKRLEDPDSGDTI